MTNVCTHILRNRRHAPGKRGTCARGHRYLLALTVAAAIMLAGRIACASIIDDCVREGLEGLLHHIVGRVNAMGAYTIPTSFTNLFDGSASVSHAIYAKTAELYGTGIARSVASSLLACAMLVQLVRIASAAEANQTFPAVREVVTLLVVCVVYTYLVGHAFDLMRAIFEDLARIWSGWDATTPRTIDDIDIGTAEGLASLFPLLISSMVCLVLAEAAVIIAKVVIWARGVQVYFMAMMSPIPLALLSLEETRSLGISFLKNFCALVLGYASLAFVLDLFPSLLLMAVETSWQAGGTGEMVLSVMAGCVLQVALIIRSGSWARDLLGG